jgi:hypothetical protein
MAGLVGGPAPARHGEDHEPAGPNDPPDLARGFVGSRVGHATEDAEGERDVDLPIPEGKGDRIAEREDR